MLLGAKMKDFLFANGAAAVNYAILYLGALLGALILHIFSFDRGFQGAKGVLVQLWPGKTDVFYYRLNFVLMIILGPIVGLVMTDPSYVKQAFAAGLGWVGVINTAIGKA
jgi:hypothetical protein